MLFSLASNLGKLDTSQEGELVVPHLLELGDLVCLLEGQADVVEALDKAVLAERVHLKADALPIGSHDLLVGQVDLKFLRLFRILHEHSDLSLGEDDRKHTILEAIVKEDVRKAACDDAANAEVRDGPRSMLTRGSASKVVAGNEDLGLLVGSLVQHELWILLPICIVSHLVESAHAKPRPLNCLQELLGDDHVCVDVLDIHRSCSTLEVDKFGHPACL
mmetsp:Transcript_4625/g.16825  ORF Transcript_4625/g.16825 Transcript_4625/m.16825 type:complete len:219 (-) Transcript_4625:1739-2395(-)